MSGAGGMRCCGLQRQHEEGHTFSRAERATLAQLEPVGSRYYCAVGAGRPQLGQNVNNSKVPTANHVTIKWSLIRH